MISSIFNVQYTVIIMYFATLQLSATSCCWMAAGCLVVAPGMLQKGAPICGQRL